MVFSAVDVARTRQAAVILCAAGVTTPAMQAAASNRRPGNDVIAAVLREVHSHATIAERLGVDVGFLPTVPADPPAGAAPTVAATVNDASPDGANPPPSPAAMFDFDGTLGSLHGIPITDIADLSDTDRKRLEKAGISTVFDLLMRVPLRYIDRSHLTPLAGIRPGDTSVTFSATITSITARHGRVSYTRMSLAGDDGATATAMFFRAPWMARRFRQGQHVIVWGDAEDYNGTLSFSSPLISDAHTDDTPIVAIYPQSPTNGVTTWLLSRATRAALTQLGPLSDPIDQAILDRYNLPSRRDALTMVHRPRSVQDATEGRWRLVFDELLRLQLAVGVVAGGKRAAQGISNRAAGVLLEGWKQRLPYTLTGAQQRAIADIRADMARPRPMNRLVQGDVGAGKTAVIIASALLAVESGHQTVILAPSEILARQHFDDMHTALKPLGVQVDLLVSKHLPRKRKDVLADIADGTSHILVGTHAVLSPTVTYHNLGLIVVDEQHRFGVDQRAALTGRGAGGATPDMLQATATPIPRTSAITVFGDMETTVLDEKPPGRKPVTTRWIVDANSPQADCWEHVRNQVAAGHQAFVVCPLVTNSDGKTSETKMAASAEKTAEWLTSASILPGCSIGVVHGKQNPTDRADTMSQFADGNLNVLVATTVIEVGVSIPNATVMVILDATKFGLAQLHQLRGRVGRGSDPATCFLVGEATGSGQQRMNAMVETTDGFRLAAMDLAIRGPGSLTSTAQAGKESGLLIADLIQDENIHLAARKEAKAILATDPTLSRNSVLRHEVADALGDDVDYLAKS